MKSKILKYIKGELSFSKKIKMIEWVNKTEANHKKFNILKANYIASKLKSLPNDISMNTMFLIK